MATYVYRRNHRSDPRTTDETEVKGPFWSLWRSKLPPAGTLAIGDHVVLLDHWRDDDRLSWELEVDRAEHHRYDTKDEAIRTIAAAFEVSETDLSEDPYISAKPDGPGVLLAWTGRPLRRLDLPRPTGLSVGRHGWVMVDEGSALTWWDLDAMAAGGPDEGGDRSGEVVGSEGAEPAELDDAEWGGEPDLRDDQVPEPRHGSDSGPGEAGPDAHDGSDGSPSTEPDAAHDHRGYEPRDAAQDGLGGPIRPVRPSTDAATADIPHAWFT